MSDSNPHVCGVHLVGSVSFENSKEVFENVSAVLGQHLRRLPDGETGIRSNWVDWQLPILEQNPNLELFANDAYVYTQIKQLRLKQGCDSKNLDLTDLGYAEVALTSYREFSSLKESGVVPQHCRFQVCLPTPLATTHLYIDSSLQADFEPQYELKLLEDLKTILSMIPHEELAIQWDTAVEFALLEGVMPSYIENLYQGIVERLLRLTNQVPEDVEMGFHLCYGDSQHKHFCEPADTGKLVMVANSIAGGASRPLNWIHIPVPKDRSDDAYYQPLADLKLADETELYLGLVHLGDREEGASRRIESAGNYVSEFGVATECGYGRRPTETIDELMQIHSALAEPRN